MPSSFDKIINNFSIVFTVDIGHLRDILCSFFGFWGFLATIFFNPKGCKNFPHRGVPPVFCPVKIDYRDRADCGAL